MFEVAESIDDGHKVQPIDAIKNRTHKSATQEPMPWKPHAWFINFLLF